MEFKPARDHTVDWATTTAPEYQGPERASKVWLALAGVTLALVAVVALTLSGAAPSVLAASVVVEAGFLAGMVLLIAALRLRDRRVRRLLDARDAQKPPATTTPQTKEG